MELRFIHFSGCDVRNGKTASGVMTSLRQWSNFSLTLCLKEKILPRYYPRYPLKIAVACYAR